MNKQTLIIYDFQRLFNILFEIKDILSFDLANIKEKEKSKINEKNYGNYLIISQKVLDNTENQICLIKYPINILDLIEKINIKFIRNNYDKQSKVNLGSYSLDINSRIISNNSGSLKLTEREIDIILFLKNTNVSQSIDSLQKIVWGHNSSLETHTVETHIYRLRKKINEIFQDDNFIISTKEGYKIL